MLEHPSRPFKNFGPLYALDFEKLLCGNAVGNGSDWTGSRVVASPGYSASRGGCIAGLSCSIYRRLIYCGCPALSMNAVRVQKQGTMSP